MVTNYWVEIGIRTIRFPMFYIVAIRNILLHADYNSSQPQRSVSLSLRLPSHVCVCVRWFRSGKVSIGERCQVGKTRSSLHIGSQLVTDADNRYLRYHTRSTILAEHTACIWLALFSIYYIRTSSIVYVVTRYLKTRHVSSFNKGRAELQMLVPCDGGPD